MTYDIDTLEFILKWNKKVLPTLDKDIKYTVESMFEIMINILGRDVLAPFNRITWQDDEHLLGLKSNFLETRGYFYTVL